MARMTRSLAVTLSALCLLAAAQAPSVSDMNTRLRAEETNNSKAMWIMHEITDVYGPRLTGSPGLRSAQDFVVGMMKSWGLSNVHLEAWTFNHPGWENYDLEANAIAPFQQPLDVRAVSWRPGRLRRRRQRAGAAGRRADGNLARADAAAGASADGAGDAGGARPVSGFDQG